jgi:anti-sigma factor RsiW
MQHLDEGTIHSWLDGALTPDEAASVEAHVAECAECRAKVAEARGFIAGASRILTALDDVPSGVVPVAQPARRVNRKFLRAAAVVLVVATGGLLVMRGTGNGPAASATSGAERGSIAAAEQPAGKVAVVAPPTTTSAPTPKPTPSSALSNPSAVKPAGPITPELRQRIVTSPSVVAFSPRAVPTASKETLFSPTAAPSTAPMVATTVAPEVAGGKPKVRNLDTTIDFVLQPDVNRLQAVVTTGVTAASATAVIPLKIVREDRIPGGRRTTYEVAPGKLVYLSVMDSAQTSASSAPQLLRVDYRARPSITWIGRSGKVMVLSGDFSVEELERIRQQIETQKK